MKCSVPSRTQTEFERAQRERHARAGRSGHFGDLRSMTIPIFFVYRGVDRFPDIAGFRVAPWIAVARPHQAFRGLAKEG